MRYENCYVSFTEFPNRVSLVITITGCPFKCEGCHSPELRNPGLGTPLDIYKLNELMYLYEDSVDNIIFFGGDQYREEFLVLLKHLKTYTKKDIILWTGANKVHPEILQLLDYVKLGKYIKSLGGLDSPNTNQVFLKLPEQLDITHIFKKG